MYNIKINVLYIVQILLIVIVHVNANKVIMAKTAEKISLKFYKILKIIFKYKNNN